MSGVPAGLQSSLDQTWVPPRVMKSSSCADPTSRVQVTFPVLVTFRRSRGVEPTEYVAESVLADTWITEAGHALTATGVGVGVGDGVRLAVGVGEGAAELAGGDEVDTTGVGVGLGAEEPPPAEATSQRTNSRMSTRTSRSRIRRRQ